MKFDYILVADEAQILDIYVEPEKRRQGIAERTLRDWLAKLPPKTKVFLEVRENNLPAKNLYAKLGFKEIYRRKNYYHNPLEDAIVMQLIL